MEDVIKKSCGQSGSDGNQFKRVKRIEIKASYQEFEKLRELAHKSGYSSVAQYLRENGLSNQAIYSQTKKMEALRQCQFELNKIGVNINQISHHLNSNPKTAITEETMLVLMQISELAGNIYKASQGEK